MFANLRRAWRAIAGEPRFHPQVIHDLYEIELRTMRAEDDRRILRRADINVEELRERMRTGNGPPRTILQDVAPVWGRKAS